MVKLYIGVVWTKIYGLTDYYITKIKEELRFHPEGYFFSKRYNQHKADGTRVWDGWVNLFFLKNGMYFTYSGLVSRIIPILKNDNIDFEIIKQYDNSNIPTTDTVLNNIALRDYQIEAVNAIKKKKRGIIKLPTGAGKTLIFVKAVADIGLKSLIIVNRSTLFRQTIQRLKDYCGLTDDQINYIGDIKKYNPNNKITVATFQSLFIKDLTRNKIGGKVNIKLKHEEVLKAAEMIIVDEVQYLSMNELGNLLKFCNNTKIRIGTSATPTREDGYEMMLEALIGPIIYSKSMSELIQQGYLARPKIYMVKSPYYFDKNLSYKAGYDNFIKNETKNKLIAEIAYRFAKTGKSVLISFTRIEHLKLVKKELDEINKLNLVIKTVIGKNTADQ